MEQNGNYSLELFNRRLPIKDNECILQAQDYPTEEWIKAQIKYIDSLDIGAKQLLYFYSDTGYDILNRYSKNNFTFEKEPPKALLEVLDMNMDLSTMDTWEEATDHLINKLNTLILDAPRSDSDMIVYRGKKTLHGQKVGDVYTSTFIVSASVLSRVGIKFSSRGTQRNIEKILLPNGSPALINTKSKTPLEWEILLPYGCDFQILSMELEPYLYNDPYTEIYNKKKVELINNLLTINMKMIGCPKTTITLQKRISNLDLAAAKDQMIKVP